MSTNYPRAYLVDKPPARRQFRDRSRKPTGCMVIHTAESHPDEDGPDTGAENVAGFIQRRSDPGSYHDLADSDSDVHLVPYAKAAYGDGTGSNEFAIHLSLATQAHRWATLPKAWREAAVKRLARCAARANRWLVANGHPSCPPRRITRAQSEAGEAGFITHAQRDPDRRTDPGAGFPWDLFLDTYRQLINQSEEDDPMAQFTKADLIDAAAAGAARAIEARKYVGRLEESEKPFSLVEHLLATNRHAILAHRVLKDGLAKEIAAELVRLAPDRQIDQATVEAGVTAVLTRLTKE